MYCGYNDKQQLSFFGCLFIINRHASSYGTNIFQVIFSSKFAYDKYFISLACGTVSSNLSFENNTGMIYCWCACKTNGCPFIWKPLFLFVNGFEVSLGVTDNCLSSEWWSLDKARTNPYIKMKKKVYCNYQYQYSANSHNGETPHFTNDRAIPGNEIIE